MNKLFITSEADRLTVAAILVKGVKEYFHLEYEPNPTSKKEVEE